MFYIIEHKMNISNGRSLSMSRQQLLEKAGAQIGTLAEGAGIRPIAMAIDLAGVGSEMLPSLLAHELVAGHAAMMRLMGKVDHFLGLIDGDRPPEEQDRACRQAVQLSGAAARLTERYRLGLMSLARLERWPGAEPARRRAPPNRAADTLEDDDPFDDGPGGGTRKSPAQVLAELQSLGKTIGALLPAAQAIGTKPNGNGSHSRAPANRACAPEGTSARRRGRLKHGNPSGDFMAAPRCGARTRAGCGCLQPAMANGRCRLHGGKSTGARTAAGLARCRTAGLVHGQRTAEIIDLKAAAARSSRTLHALSRAARANLQSERPTPCPATANGWQHTVGAPPCGRPSFRGTAGRPHGAGREQPHSERPTPCPATATAYGAHATRPHRSGTSAFIPAYPCSSVVNLPTATAPIRRRAAAGGAACHSVRRRAIR